METVTKGADRVGRAAETGEEGIDGGSLVRKDTVVGKRGGRGREGVEKRETDEGGGREVSTHERVTERQMERVRASGGARERESPRGGVSARDGERGGRRDGEREGERDEERENILSSSEIYTPTHTHTHTHTHTSVLSTFLSWLSVGTINV